MAASHRVGRRSTTAPDSTGTIEITAAPAVVYSAIVGGLAEFSEETVRMIPLGKRRFFGINRRPGRTWTSITRVTDDVPGERYAFNVSVPVVPVSRWEYVIAPTATGCRVTESAWDRRPRWAVPLTVLVTGVSDRQATNTANIAATLARLKARCEA